MPSGLLLVCYFLAVTRLTMIVAVDEISRPARMAMVKRLNPHNRTHRMLFYALGDVDDERSEGCPWCISVWISAITSPMFYFWHDTPYAIITVLALAASQIAGMLKEIGR